ncbi:MAG: RNA-guided pseudouridylation complex pseudouridine synthase subunit Cbf5 [Nitrosopumilaceae archaeon]|jgi:H/ACA ribonucleoprotein complex subunit 4|uniref:RNA-guided pseudouridylation complex pseudouridine synthase subunit Cbf5 n=3 Tax=Candidatus Nitrosomaritimum aestuariumsis TaxID=3342354 RepID=A0AC60VZP5_9ARCH|nr:RNA-guided pseudouridylation complex pseudouridine synthase subunit Cbf5 [Nitrosopumilaceae archaeon]MBA4454637.1 RNA-guided pseudouridylation complex pseudouridine synthase subunit Cbf5 [Nitrosopumilaceae archaeon]MBA4459557.1 RNA-guided pseudouridylation complex pseudouridine synthase subunit Cbf5 [Nitrosopumilaceae archaeon]MBA4461322.1 RNA-guided pseudouridylation complex pseudouridine synthase subunit Cbf5 [Nitrosopumilaceae archaeon]MBA4462849.1 RNA-guided pseudouridylation complex pse
MTLQQLENLVEIDQDITDNAYGTNYDERTIEQLLQYGLIILDKPPGPTSHETVAWTKRLLKLPKIGHSGTLDPQVSGVLPLGLGEATKALGVLLYGPKEYHALGRIHSLPSKEKLNEIIQMFTGEIFQKPPQRSAVVRQTRTRTIHEFEVIEQKERLLLTRILCESGTYIRKLYYDMGEVLGPGATMIELRRTRVDQFRESDGLVTLHELANAFSVWEEKKDETKLRSMIKPIEYALSEIKSVVVRDSAVDAMCHGAQLAIPGILQISPNLKKGDIVAVYTQKGEVVALAESTMSETEIKDATKGYAFETKRIIMAPDTYPRKWRTKPTPKD